MRGVLVYVGGTRSICCGYAGGLCIVLCVESVCLVKKLMDIFHYLAGLQKYY